MFDNLSGFLASDAHLFVNILAIVGVVAIVIGVALAFTHALGRHAKIQALPSIALTDDASQTENVSLTNNTPQSDSEIIPTTPHQQHSLNNEILGRACQAMHLPIMLLSDTGDIRFMNRACAQALEDALKTLSPIKEGDNIFKILEKVGQSSESEEDSRSDSSLNSSLNKVLQGDIESCESSFQIQVNDDDKVIKMIASALNGSQDVSGILIMMLSDAQAHIEGQASEKAEESDTGAASEESFMTVPQTLSRSTENPFKRYQDELKTPLNSILGFSQLLNELATETANETIQDYANHIVQNSQALLARMNKMLTQSERSEEEISLHLVPVEANDVLHQTTSLLTMQLKEKDIQLHFSSNDDSRVYVNADIQRLKQCCYTLLSLVIDRASRSDHVTIETKVIDNQILRLHISRVAKGFVDEVKTMLNPASQNSGHKSIVSEHEENAHQENTDEVNRQNGSSLVWVSHLIKRMNGRLGAQRDSLGAGSVWIELPISQIDASNENVLSDSAYTVPASTESAMLDKITDKLEELSRSGEARIVYIEDNPSNLRFMKKVVEQIPNAVMLSAHDAESGITLIEQTCPQLILMDINLPGMSGVEALQCLRNNARLADIPVIAVSADAMAENIQQALAAGFQAYITKPVNIPLLMDTMNEFLPKDEQSRRQA